MSLKIKAVRYFETPVNIRHSTLWNIVSFLDLLEGIVLLRNVGKCSPVATEQHPIRRKLEVCTTDRVILSGPKERRILFYSSIFYVGCTVTIDKESEHFFFLTLKQGRGNPI